MWLLYLYEVVSMVRKRFYHLWHECYPLSEVVLPLYLFSHFCELTHPFREWLDPSVLLRQLLLVSPPRSDLEALEILGLGFLVRTRTSVGSLD